ncbi:MAG: hypothetical protein HZA90_18675 [Verrucomicrobia bacterium]|nr:hypothetical protein [Verrucomicrobiota bacterium]
METCLNQVLGTRSCEEYFLAWRDWLAHKSGFWFVRSLVDNQVALSPDLMRLLGQPELMDHDDLVQQHCRIEDQPCLQMAIEKSMRIMQAHETAVSILCPNHQPVTVRWREIPYRCPGATDCDHICSVAVGLVLVDSLQTAALADEGQTMA